MSAIILLILRFALAAFLYFFLGWIVLTIWRGIKNQEAQLVANQIIPIRLNYQEAEEGKELRLLKAEIILGRDPGCDCVLNDKTVSNRHARLSFRQQMWWLDDLGSTNGTLLNQEPVLSPMVLANGDQVTCGQVILTIHLENQPQKNGEVLPA